jgi:hypothetical protein
MVAQLNGAPAGQSVFHLHSRGSAIGQDLRMPAGDGRPQVLAEHAERIRAAM